jgi:hypothetical protein
LTKTNELGYQLPFCQLLLSEGYKIIQISKHNAFEQGKDIIAIDKKGMACAFQLKGGTISSEKWRNVVKGEVEELVELQIVHPSIVRDKKHKSFLVTNSILEDTVRLAIKNLNSGRWKKTPLQVIAKGELLKKFSDLSGNFVPQEIENYKSFLELFFADGKELIDEKKYTDFIMEVLRLDDDELKNEERKRNIASAVMYTSYIISAFQKNGNYISEIQTLTLLCAYIFALVEKYQLEERYWESSFQIIWDELKNTYLLLQKEIINEKGFEKIYNSLWDGEISLYRKHVGASYLICFKISQLLEGDKGWSDISEEDFDCQIKNSLCIWGEAGLFPFLLLFFYYLQTQKPAKEKAILLLKLLLINMIKLNGKDSEGLLLTPYYDITTLLKMKFRLLEEIIDDSFLGRSSFIGSVIDLLARYGEKKVLEDNWRAISYICQESFYPDSLWQHFLWRCKNGNNWSEFPEPTQSWQKLVQQANKVDQEMVPATLKKHPYFIPLFLLIYPHRITSNYIKFLDELMKSKSIVDDGCSPS